MAKAAAVRRPRARRRDNEIMLAFLQGGPALAAGVACSGIDVDMGRGVASGQPVE
jgi:hypothetical protein